MSQLNPFKSNKYLALLNAHPAVPAGLRFQLNGRAPASDVSGIDQGVVAQSSGAVMPGRHAGPRRRPGVAHSTPETPHLAQSAEAKDVNVANPAEDTCCRHPGHQGKKEADRQQTGPGGWESRRIHRGSGRPGCVETVARLVEPASKPTVPGEGRRLGFLSPCDTQSFFSATGRALRPHPAWITVPLPGGQSRFPFPSPVQPDIPGACRNPPLPCSSIGMGH